MIIYLSGPMTGLPQNNCPAFNAVAAYYRAQHYTVLNPAETPPQPSWACYMRRALEQLAQADMIAMLPGWADSRGACIERRIAYDLEILTIELTQSKLDLIMFNHINP